MIATRFEYRGAELELFSRARNWKQYWSAEIRPYLGPRVLEVGAGIGSNTGLLNQGATEWVCLEPDADQARILMARQRGVPGAQTIVGVIGDIPSVPRFDSIVYIDVLEHIEDDRAEIAAAAARLRPGGALIVLSPAHSWLFSKFDTALGHFRRYSSEALLALTSPELEIVTVRQLDSVGMIASLANRLLLSSAMPTVSQILLWDRVMVPMSRLLDPLLAYRCGKSIIAVWRRRPVDHAATAFAPAVPGLTAE